MVFGLFGGGDFLRAGLVVVEVECFRTVWYLEGKDLGLDGSFVTVLEDLGMAIEIV